MLAGVGRLLATCGVQACLATGPAEQPQMCTCQLSWSRGREEQEKSHIQTRHLAMRRSVLGGSMAVRFVVCRYWGDAEELRNRGVLRRPLPCEFSELCAHVSGLNEPNLQALGIPARRCTGPVPWYSHALSSKYYNHQLPRVRNTVDNNQVTQRKKKKQVLSQSGITEIQKGIKDPCHFRQWKSRRCARAKKSLTAWGLVSKMLARSLVSALPLHNSIGAMWILEPAAYEYRLSACLTIQVQHLPGIRAPTGR